MKLHVSHCVASLVPSPTIEAKDRYSISPPPPAFQQSSVKWQVNVPDPLLWQGELKAILSLQCGAGNETTIYVAAVLVSFPAHSQGLLGLGIAYSTPP